MRYKLATLFFVASCLPAMAALPSQGNKALVAGRAHIERAAQGTYITIENPRLAQSVAGFIPFGDESTFPGLYQLDGRRVALSGALVWDGQPLIIMNDPAQLSVG